MEVDFCHRRCICVEHSGREFFIIVSVNFGTQAEIRHSIDQAISDGIAGKKTGKHFNIMILIFPSVNVRIMSIHK